MSLGHGPSIVRNGLVLYLDAANVKSYPGSGTTWTDLSGLGNNGTLTNGPTYNGSNAGNIVLDGTNDSISTTRAITSTPALSNWTYEIWTSLSAWPTAVSPANVYGRVDRAGVLMGAASYAGAAIYWYGNSNGSTSTPGGNTGAGSACTVGAYIRGTDGYRRTTIFSMSLNTVYQFVMVNNNSLSTIFFYVNGVLHASMDGATQEYNSSFVSGLNIGIGTAQVDGGGEANYSTYPGNIFAAKIYNRALTAAEIQQNFNALRGRFGI